MVDTTRVKGVFLERAVHQLEDDNDELKSTMAAGKLEKISTIKRKIKRAATSALYEQETKSAKDNLTVTELEKRKKELEKQGSLMAVITKNARTRLDGGEAPTRPRSTTEGPVDTTREDNLNYSDIRAEEDYAGIEGRITVDVDDAERMHEDDPTYQEDPTEYLEAVRMFMECSLQDRFVERKEDKLICDLCVQDPTMGEEHKTKVWSNATKLLAHKRTKVHCLYMAWLRRI
jgi:hypothetical protein